MNGPLHRRVALALALTIAGLGVAIVVSTAAQGGGTNGYLIGAMFIALGSGRLYLLRRRG